MLCLVQKLRTRSVKPEEYGLPLFALLSGEEAKSSEVESFDDEMLFMAGFSDSQVTSFLTGMRKKRIAPVALKAVLTSQNREWDSAKLRNELALEHEAELQGRTAHQE